MADLYLSVTGEYFREISSGRKTREYRLRNDYWRKRLESRCYGNIFIRNGYPARDDMSRVLKFPWQGYEEQTITHKHFGDKPVDVFAIILERPT